MKLLAIIMFSAVNTMGGNYEPDMGNKYYKYTEEPTQSNKYSYTPAPTTTTTSKYTPPKIGLDNNCYDISYDNPCNNPHREANYFRSCSSCCKFIQCHDSGRAEERSCAEGTSWSQLVQRCIHNYGQCQDTCATYEPPQYTPEPTTQQYTPEQTKKQYTPEPTTQQYTPEQTKKQYIPVIDNKCYNCNDNSPCNAAQRESGIYYFKSCNSCSNYIQCDDFGEAEEKPCPAGTSWDQQTLTCNYNNNGQCKDVKPVIDNKCYDIKYNNPCNAVQRASGLYYFKSCDSCCNFIQCDDFGVAYSQPCGEGTYWDQSVLTCNHNDNYQCSEECGNNGYVPPVDHKCYDTQWNSPCTEENINNGKLYFKSCSGPCNYIQCSEYGEATEQSCGTGTYWDQSKLTCNHNEGQCSRKCYTQNNKRNGYEKI